MEINTSTSTTAFIMNTNTAFMASPIGDLPINSKGLRAAIDEIVRLRRVIDNMQMQKMLEESMRNYGKPFPGETSRGKDE